MGKRVDNILIIQDLILVIEFKVGDTQYSHSAQIQVIDYCLDLLNFHAGSHNQKVIPVLVATQAGETRQNWEEIASLNEAACCNAENFGEILSEIIQQFSHNSIINTQSWLEAPTNRHRQLLKQHKLYIKAIKSKKFLVVMQV